ncbi:MAG: 4-hydroxy-tetrahydrodipicolinate synthase [Deltaproteobacteria bacterium]|nr:4-hydroxy-tetrahydrodipicolinate synthase [Deltaproteobacteria bacterium]
MFKGSIVAIVTPFKNGKVDEKALGELIECQIANGTDGIVPCGTTGESPTLSGEEHGRVIEITVAAVNKRVPVIAGTGSNSTEEAIQFTKHAYKVGADGALVVAPYYNRPTQEGLFQHYAAIAEATPLPIIVYNIESRSAVNIETPTLARMANIPNIVGVKEASGKIKQMSDVIRTCGSDFCVLSGDDAFTLPLMALGGHGIISVVANIVPADMAALVDAFFAGDLARARELHHKLMPLVDAMFIETNPAPVKVALELMGKISGDVRLPLCRLTEANLAKLKNTMLNYGLI